jgi:hypothetical protein
MLALLNVVKAVVVKLVGATTFPDRTGPNRALRYSLGALPDKRDDVAQGEDFPFCLLAPGKHALGREGKSQVVEIVFGLYTPGDKLAGLTLADSVLGLMTPAVREIYSPYKLQGELTGEINTERHPYYILTLSGEFRKAR